MGRRRRHVTHSRQRRLAAPGQPVHAPQRAGDDHHCSDPRPRRGEHSRGDAEHILAGGQIFARHAGAGRGEQHDADAEPAEQHEPPPRPVAGRSPGQQVDRAQRQPRHVQHRAGKVEHAERGQAPTAGLGPPQGAGAEGEQGQRHRPGQFVRAVTAQPAVQRAEGKAQGDQGRGGGQCGVHRPSTVVGDPIGVTEIRQWMRCCFVNIRTSA